MSPSVRTNFPLFQSHLDFTHQFWTKLVEKGDTIIDATCGNGYDTLKISQLALTASSGRVYSFDKQSDAIESTRQLLKSHLPSELQDRILLEMRCHSSFPSEIETGTVKLVVYNLGYLPGGDKSKTTEVTTTLQSLDAAKSLLKEGGVLSLTCYPGHYEGEKEQINLLEKGLDLTPHEWSVSHHTWINRHLSPTVLLIQKKLSKANDCCIAKN